MVCGLSSGARKNLPSRYALMAWCIPSSLQCVRIGSSRCVLAETCLSISAWSTCDRNNHRSSAEGVQIGGHYYFKLPTVSRHWLLGGALCESSVVMAWRNNDGSVLTSFVTWDDYMMYDEENFDYRPVINPPPPANLKSP